MERVKTEKEKCALLKMRGARLIYFIETFDGKPEEAIENNAYLVLESHQTRSRAIARYIRFAIKQWLDKNQYMLEFRVRLFYYRRIKGLEYGAAIELAHATLEERIFSSMKGANNARPR